MRKKIKTFEPLSVMRIAGVCYAILGLIEGALISLMMLGFGSAAAGGNHPMPRMMGIFFSGFAVVVLPVVMGIFGAIAGGLGAVVYNVVSRYVGGIEVEVD